MDQVYTPKVLKDSELSDSEVARRIIIVNNLRQIESRINSLKSSIFRQHEHEMIYDQFGTIEFIIQHIHDIVVVSKYEKTKSATQNNVEGAREQSSK